VNRSGHDYCQICIPMLRQICANVLHYVDRYAYRSEGHRTHSHSLEGQDSKRFRVKQVDPLTLPCVGQFVSVPNKASIKHRTVTR